MMGLRREMDNAIKKAEHLEYIDLRHNQIQLAGVERFLIEAVMVRQDMPPSDKKLILNVHENPTGTRVPQPSRASEWQKVIKIDAPAL